MIPCKECLILPICRNKLTISCNILYEWYWHWGDAWMVRWDNILEQFPECRGVRPDKRSTR